jgi:AcrR family transcriptional regulator
MSVAKQDQKLASRARPARDRRSQILEAAAEVFAARGFHDAKVSDIVRRAGVAQGTFYLYFKTKTEVMSELVDKCCRDVIGKLIACSKDRREIGDPALLRQRNISFLIDVFNVLEGDHQAVKVILAKSAGVDPEIDNRLTNLKDTLVKLTQDNLERGIAGGGVRPLNTAIAAEAIVGMIYHLAFERFVRGRLLGVGLAELAEEVIDLEIYGIAKRGLDD